MNIIRLHSTFRQVLCTCIQVDSNHNHGAIPLFYYPCRFSVYIPFYSFTYLETLLGVIGSRPPWSQVTRELNSPSSTPPHPSPFQIPGIPSQISPASRANKDDDSTPASRVRNSNEVLFRFKHTILLSKTYTVDSCSI